jgi:hypothetical protein
MSNMDCRNNVPTIPVSPLVDTGVAFMQTNAQTWANEAVGLAQALEDFSVTPLAFTPPTFPALHFESFVKPGLPGEYTEPKALADSKAPNKVTLTAAEFVSPGKLDDPPKSDYVLSNVTFNPPTEPQDVPPPNYELTATPFVKPPDHDPAPIANYALIDPVFNAPYKEYGVSPEKPNIDGIPSPVLIGDTLTRPTPVTPDFSGAKPVYSGGPMPPAPTLRDLDLPDKPTITLEDFDIERPDFEALLPPYLENNYYADVDTRRVQALTELRSSDVDGQAVRARWNEMILGGTGLPIPIEQALFDRGIWREDMVSQQAINQAHQEWAARGFTLPGSTLLARVSEVRNTNRMARAGTNRELTIQYHEKEIENMRFAVQQGVALESQWTAQFTQTYDLAKQTADGYYRVAVAVLEAQVSYLRARIDIYQADIQAFRDRVQIELAKLEVYRGELEAQRLIGELNKLDVDIYNGRIQGVLAAVSVFRAEIEAFRAGIEVETAKVQIYRAEVDAYRALLETDRTQVDIFTARINAEDSKVRLFTAEVQAFAEKIRAYTAEVNAESAKVDAEVRIDEAKVRLFAAEVQAFGEKIRAYTAQIQAESARVDAETRIDEAKSRQYVAEIQAYGEGVRAYTARVQAESARVDANTRIDEAKVRTFTAEVQAFAERVRAYSAEVQAESSRVDAVTRIDEAKVRQYVAESEGWATQMRVDIERIRAALGVFEAETGRYNAELSAESARVQGESRNTEIAANRTNAEVAAALKRADQQLEQMRHITSLAVTSLEGAARTYSQLTGAALSAVNLSAGISQGFTSSESKSCSLSYNYSGDT